MPQYEEIVKPQSVNYDYCDRLPAPVEDSYTSVCPQICTVRLAWFYADVLEAILDLQPSSYVACPAATNDPSGCGLIVVCGRPQTNPCINSLLETKMDVASSMDRAY